MIRRSLRSTWAFLAYLVSMTAMAIYAVEKTPTDVGEIVVGYFMWLTIGTGAYIGKRWADKKIQGVINGTQEDPDLPIR